MCQHRLQHSRALIRLRGFRVQQHTNARTKTPCIIFMGIRGILGIVVKLAVARKSKAQLYSQTHKKNEILWPQQTQLSLSNNLSLSPFDVIVVVSLSTVYYIGEFNYAAANSSSIRQFSRARIAELSERATRLFITMYIMYGTFIYIYYGDTYGASANSHAQTSRSAPTYRCYSGN